MQIYFQDGKDNNPLLKKLDEKLNSSPNSLCSNRSDRFCQVVEKKKDCIPRCKLKKILFQYVIYINFYCYTLKKKCIIYLARLKDEPSLL